MMICKNCGNSFHGSYCNNCGQKNYTAKDKTLKGIAEEVLHFLTHFEGSFWVTLKTVLLHPGKLSDDYCNGIRKKYYKPISLFLLLIVLYLLFPVFHGLNMDMQLYKYIIGFGGLIETQIQSKMAATSMSISELSIAFASKSEKMAKVLLLILIPLSAGALHLLHFRKRKPAYDLFILATEINIFMLFFFFLLPPALLSLIFWIFPGGDIFDTPMTIFFAIAFIIFLIVAFRRFFKISKWWAFVSSVLFLFLYVIITVVIYKLLLFELTFLFI